MSASHETIDLLKSIDATLKRIEKALGASSSVAAVASDRDLDSQYGDPTVGFSPRDWRGPAFKGRKFSACAPEFLDMLAETLDYLAGKAAEKNELTAGGKSVADYKRKDAARARGWAKRIRAGIAPGTPVAATPGPRRIPPTWATDTDTNATGPVDDIPDGADDENPFVEDATAGLPVAASGIRW